MIIHSVVDVLESKGNYHRVPQPLHIADVEFQFQFNAVLRGPGDQGSLVLVSSTIDIPISAVERRIKAFSIILGRSGSMRPITLVLITGNPNEETITALQDLCRVIVVPSDVEDPKGYLRTLLPLDLPDPVKTMESADIALREELGDNINDPLISKLLKAASKGSTEVELAMRELINHAADFDIANGEN